MTTQEQFCRICGQAATVEDWPAREDTVRVYGCNCQGPFRVQGLFWMAADSLRGQEADRLQRLCRYLRAQAKAGLEPVVMIDNWRGLADTAPK